MRVSYLGGISREQFERIPPLKRSTRKKTTPPWLICTMCFVPCCACCTRAASAGPCLAAFPNGALCMPTFRS